MPYLPRKLLSSVALFSSFVFLIYLLTSISVYSEENPPEAILRVKERPKPKFHFLSDSRESLNEASSAENGISSAGNDRLGTAHQQRLAANDKTTAKPSEEQDQFTNEASTADKEQTNKPKIWVSMGLCFSHNTEKYGKKQYPYSEVTPMAILLWHHFFPNTDDVDVILYLIYTEPRITAHMRKYETALNATGVHLQWVPADGMDCVLKSQLIRMFAFGHPLVAPKDIVMTVDVNLFLMTNKIFDPIYKQPDLLAWVYQYDDSAYSTSGYGETFNQNLIALPARMWRSVLEAPSQLTKEWLQEKIDSIKLDTNNTWYDDQWITTFSLLKRRICSAPPESGLWNRPGLEFDPEFDDTETCYHGRYYSDCNEEVRIVAEGCKWWHFYPSQRFEDHLKKFNQITNNSYILDVSEMFKK